MKLQLVFLWVFSFQLLIFGQSIDSLKQNLLIQKNDTNKVKAYFDLANAIYISDLDLANLYCDSALVLSESLNYSYGIAESCGWISYFLQSKGKTRDALPYELKALVMREKSGDKKGISTSLNNIGYVYESIGDLKKAIEHYEKCLEIRETLGDEIAIANVLNNLGYIHDVSGEKEKALLYYLRSLNILEKTDDKSGIARQYHNIAAIYFDNNKQEKGVETIKKAVLLNSEARSFEGLIVNYNLLSNFYIKKNQLENALDATKTSEKLAIEHNYPNHLKTIKRIFYSIYQKKGDYKLALDYFKGFAELRDSLLRADNNRQFAESEAKYQNGKKQLEIDNLNKDKILNVLEMENKESKINQQRYALIVSIVGFLIVLTFSFYITKALKEKKRINALIIAQKKETEFQKHLVEEHQKEIIDSIRYAKRLQQAILPPVELLRKHLPNGFVLYKPKDIVAGDFYWMEVIDDIIFVAAADSTGHGVPGAMVSVVCSNALNRTVNEFALRDTGKILDKVTDLVLETFEKSGEQIKDGMDISLLRIDLHGFLNLESIARIPAKIQWSGANNPLWYIQNLPTGQAGGQVLEIKADKQPVGKFDVRKPFTAHNIEVFPNGGATTFYLFTDGLPDQFGGPKGKKFMYKRFENKLADICKLPMDEQQGILEKAFTEWKGSLEQVDDVTVIGIRI